MEEGLRIKKLFFDLYDGTPWTEIKLTGVLSGITAEQAAQRSIPNANTIWQLVQHCVGWRINVLRKLQGMEFASPGDNYLSDPDDTSDAAWKTLLETLKQTEDDWGKYLSGVEDSFLMQGYKPAPKFTNYEVIQGILHHDNYHFGQIMMLKKMVR